VNMAAGPSGGQGGEPRYRRVRDARAGTTLIPQA